jgi:hypothetical protein
VDKANAIVCGEKAHRGWKVVRDGYYGRPPRRRHLRPVTDGLALLPYSNSVHHDSEAQRRPLYQRLVADGTLPAGYATDDGVGLGYRGTELAEAVADRPGKAAYRVQRGAAGQAVDTRIPARRLR